jgi:hypothetical protein
LKLIFVSPVIFILQIVIDVNLGLLRCALGYVKGGSARSRRVIRVN